MTVVVSPIFGPMLTGAQLEDAVQATLEEWLPSYLREMERQHEIPPNSLLPIASLLRVNEFAQAQGEPLPAAVIVAPGTEGEFERDGDGNYRAWWTVAIGVIVEAVNDVSARRLAQLYAAAILKVAIDKPSFGGFARAVDPGLITGEDAPADVLAGGVAVCRVVLSVLVEGLAVETGGPPEPTDAPQPWPEVQTVEIDIEPEALPT